MRPICKKSVVCRNFFIRSLINHIIPYSQCFQIIKLEAGIIFCYPKLWNILNSANNKAKNTCNKKKVFKEEEAYFNII